MSPAPATTQVEACLPEAGVRELADTVGTALLTDALPLRTELGQVRELLRNALAQLQESFFGIEAQVQTHTSEVQALFESIESTQAALAKQLGETGRAITAVRQILDGTGTDGGPGLPSLSDNVTTMLERISALDAVAAERMEELAGLAAEVRANVNAAVRALQVEDMATQLIDCSGRRVDRVQALAARLAEIATPSSTPLATPLHEVLDAIRAASATPLSSPVAQVSVVENGDIEFF